MNMDLGGGGKLPLPPFLFWKELLGKTGVRKNAHN